MEVTKDNVHQAVTALRQCAKEHSKEYPATGQVRTADLCEDVANFLEKEFMKKEECENGEK